MKRHWAILCCLPMLVSTASAYYHFTHYTNRTAPFNPILEKFDLAALPNKTVTFLVSDSGPTQYAGTDSFASVLSQIQQATQAWNAVDTSDLRVAFGGLFGAATPQNGPGGEVVFEELPPGILAFGGPTSFGTQGQFVPITRAIVRLNRDLTRSPGPSFSNTFFATVVHEMGHALGLQHTLTSSAMSTAVTRSTSRAKPIEADDAAGISVLYPARNFASSTGSISGRVTSGGQGIHLASVVALRQGASAISALTGPDGSYRIDGLRAGDPYLVYVHPLPPPSQTGFGPADIVLPVDPSGAPVPDSGPIETLFYPGVKDPALATPIQVAPGSRNDGIDFSVQRRTSVAIYDVSTFGFFDTIAVRPGYFVPSTGPGTLVARGSGLTAGGNTAPGLNAQVIGGSARIYSFRNYEPTSLALYMTFGLGAGTGPRHLLFSLPNDIYVVPSAMTLVQAPPPSITAVGNNFDGTATITGANLAPDTQIYFDGVPAPGVFSAGRIIVQVPPASSGYRATITAVNSDGQTNAFVQGSLPVFAYEPVDPAGITLSPSALPVGAEAMVEVTGVNTRFSDGRSVLGLGSADLFVRRAWVTGPNRMIANVAVLPAATTGPASATAVTGLQVTSLPLGFQVLPANPRLPSLNSQLTNAVSPGVGIFAGATVVLSGSNLSTGGAPVLTLNEARLPVLSAQPTQITFQIPAGTPSGPAVLRLNNGSDNALPIVVPIEAPPPQILGVIGAAALPVDASRPAQTGDFLTVLVSNLAEPGSSIAPGRARITVGGVEQNITFAGPSPTSPGQHQIQFALIAPPFTLQAPVVVTIDSRSSFPFSIPIRLQ